MQKLIYIGLMMAVGIHEGRALMYDLYSQDYERLRRASCVYITAQSVFLYHLESMRSGTALNYDLDSHRFIQALEPVALNGNLENLWKRDHIVHNIDRFVTTLFPDHELDRGAVKNWLHRKIMGTQSEYEFILSGNHEKGSKIFRFQCKVRDNRFLSPEAKTRKHAIRLSYQKDKELTSLANTRKRNWVYVMIQWILKVLKRIKKFILSLFFS